MCTPHDMVNDPETFNIARTFIETDTAWIQSQYDPHMVMQIFERLMMQQAKKYHTEITNPRGWIRRQVRLAIREHLSQLKKRTHIPLIYVEEVPDMVMEQTNPLSNQQMRNKDIRRLIHMLPLNKQFLIDSIFWGEYTISELAIELNLPVSEVTHLLREAYTFLIQNGLRIDE